MMLDLLAHTEAEAARSFEQQTTHSSMANKTSLMMMIMVYLERTVRMTSEL